MTPDTPEPGDRTDSGESATPRVPDPRDPRTPRILVNVDDLEDPAEWDVIVVEDENVDDETARAIARQRHGPRRIALPSLDERDVQAAFETDRGEGEDAETIGVDAFGLPGDVPVRRPRPVADPIEDDGFPDVPEPEPEAVEGEPVEVEVEVDGATAEAAAPEPWTPAVLEPMEPGPEHHRPTEEELDAELDDAPPMVGEPSGEEAPEPQAEPVGGHTRGLGDDLDDEFYAIGSSAIATEELERGDEDEASATADDETTHAVDAPSEDDGERTLLDDPGDDFYALGDFAARHDEQAAAAGESAAEDHHPVLGPPQPTVLHDLPDHADRLSALLWGKRPEEADGPDPAAPRQLAFGGAPAKDDVFEDETDYDSSFPLGPEDVAPRSDRPPVQIDSLDFASVFGPVEGELEVPDLDQEPQHARHHISAYYLDDTALGSVEDEPEEPDLWPVAPARSGRRRRELLVLGVAAGAMLAIGLGTQVFGRANHNHLATNGSTTTTVGQRLKVGDTPSTILSPTTEDPGVIGGTDGGTGSRSNRKPVTTTTRRTTATTAKGSVTTAAPTTTAAPATTTTAPPATTTTADQGTTGGPVG
jgi:hypothetical protein